jgi:hypothetical protein
MNIKQIDEQLDNIIASDIFMSCVYWSIVLIITKVRMVWQLN